MNHPLWDAGLLKVGKPERPGSILRIDDISYAERQRLAPDHDLITDKGGERPPLILPPGVTYRVLIVKIIHEMAETGGVSGDEAACRIGRIVRAIERIRRFG